MISVIIPVYNVGELLCRSVESVLSQLNNEHEIIIVDDGSTDNSGALCDRYAATKGIKVIHKKNGGLSSARNAGIDAAAGDYLMFLDSDDYLRPGSIQLLSEIIRQDGDVDFIQFVYDETGDYSDTRHCGSVSDKFVNTDRRKMFELKLSLGGIGASACTKLINRRVFDNLRFKEGIIHEDEQFTIHLINRAAKAIYISNPLYMYVQRPGSIITSKFSKKRLDIIPVMEEQAQVLKSNGLDDLADLVKNRLFTSLCIMYVEACQSNERTCADIIETYAKALADDVKTTGRGTIAVIAMGMKLHLPMLPLYRWFKKKRGGKLVNARIKLQTKYRQWQRRRRLKHTDFSVISNNCWAGTAIYQPFGLKYNTPTVGMFFMDEDYILFLENLQWYLSQTPQFITPRQSKYYDKISHNGSRNITYPIATIGGNVELHFLHYHDQNEALDKWLRRVKRINFDRLLVKMSLRDSGYDIEQMLERFDALEFKNKICFSPVKSDKESVIEVPELANLNLVGGDETDCTLRKIDINSLINNIK